MGNIKWQNNIKVTIEEDSKYVSHSFKSELSQEVVRRHLAKVNSTISVEMYLSNNIEGFKQRMSYASMTYQYCYQKYGNDWPYWNVKPYAYALLSDNIDLVDQFLKMEIVDREYNDAPVYFNYAIRGLLNNEEELISKAIDILDEKIRKKKEVLWSRAQKKCVLAIVDKDIGMLVEGLTDFEVSKLKKQAIDADICEEYLSFFSLFFAKIAWMKGMEVDHESEFIPLELLKADPLKEYTIPYWFLRDWYRKQGIDWRYDPIHPELQDWENDPENPNRRNSGFFRKIIK